MHKVARLALLAALVLFGGFTAGAQTPRVLIVATSHSQALGGRVTGLWLSELTEPYWVFRDAGLEVDITTIRGGSPPIDPRSGSDVSVSGALRNDSRALASRWQRSATGLQAFSALRTPTAVSTATTPCVTGT